MVSYLINMKQSPMADVENTTLQYVWLDLARLLNILDNFVILIFVSMVMWLDKEQKCHKKNVN